MEVFRVFATLGFNADEFEQGLDQAESRFSGMGMSIVKAAGKTALAAGTALAGFGAASIATSAEFEENMAKVFRAVDGLSEDMEAELTAGVRRLAVQTGISANDMAEALGSYAYSGMEVAEALEILETAAYGSIGAGEDLTTTINNLSGVEAGFRGQGVELGEVMDSLTTLSNNASGGFKALTDAVVTVTPQANAAGVSLNEAGAAIGALTWLGVPASEAATQIRGALTELNDSGRGAGEQFKKLVGVSFKDFIASGGTMEEAIAALNAGLQAQNAITGENITIGQLFGSTISGGAIEMLSAGEGAEFYGDVLGSLQNSTGSTIAAFETMQDTVGHQGAQWKAHFDEIRLAVGERLLPIWSDVLDAVNDAMPAVQAVVENVFDALIGAADWLISSWKNLQENNSGVWDGVQSAVSTAGEIISQVFELLKALWTDVLKPIWDGMAEHLGGVWSGIVDIVSGALDAISGVLDIVIGLLTGDWTRAWEGVQTLLSGVWQAVEGIVTGAVSVIQGALEGLLNLFGIPFERAWNGARDTVTGWWDSVAAFLRGLPGEMLGFGMDIVTGLADGIRNSITNAVEAVTGLGSRLLDNFKGLLGIASPSKVFHGFGLDIGEGLAQGMEASEQRVAGAAQRLGSIVADAAVASMSGAFTAENIIGGIVGNLEGKDAMRAIQERLEVLQDARNVSFARSRIGAWGAVRDTFDNQISALQEELRRLSTSLRETAQQNTRSQEIQTARFSRAVSEFDSGVRGFTLARQRY